MSLNTLLDDRAKQFGDRVLYRFLDSSGEERESLTYGELRQRAMVVANALAETTEPGDRALLLYPPGLDFIVAFFGCLYAGVVAVPAYPPGSRRNLPRVRSIARDAAPRLALTTAEQREKLETLSARAPELANVRWLATDALEGTSPATGRSSALSSDLAFLQYTSGSTAEPKGVEVTHGNLVHNEGLIQRAFGLTEESVVVGWLPLYHDMGLIGNVLQPLFAGATGVLMAPVDFLRRPRRWLEAISNFGGTTSGAPNFAYELCVRRISEEERLGLDLSSWSVAYNGAEPVRADTLESFAKAFAPNGFRRSAFLPCYGLAEGTLFVSGGPVAREPIFRRVDPEALEEHRVEAPEASDGRRLVSSGAVVEQEVAIVDSATGERVPPGRVGEIWVRGPSVARGYWNRPEASRETFGTRPVGEPGGAGFLRTGDLGFLDSSAEGAGAQLFVTGRSKDLVILRGRNYYPQDLELTAERAHEALRSGCGAAFSVESGGVEELVLVQELERRVKDLAPDEVIEAIRTALARDHEVRVLDVVLIRWGSIPKTSSGKIQRHACRRAYQQDELREIARGRWATAPEPEEPERRDLRWILELDDEGRREVLEPALRQRLAGILRLPLDEVRRGTALTALGLDSLAAVELQHALEEELGATITLAELLEDLTPARLAAMALERIATEPESGFAAFLAAAQGQDGAVAAEHRVAGKAAGDTVLAEGERALWLVQRMAPESSSYVLRAAARVQGEVAPELLRRAFETVVRRHEALRTVFPDRAGEPVAEILEVGDGGPVPGLDFRVEQTAGHTEAELMESMDWAAHRPMDPATGPLLRVVLYLRQPGEHRLLVMVHHLVVDFWSVAVIVEELALAYRRGLGEDLELPPVAPVRYRDFAAWQRYRFEDGHFEASMQYWEQALPRPLPVLDLASDRPRPPVLSDAGLAVSRRLDAPVREAVEAVARRMETTPFTVLLAGWSSLLHRLSAQPRVLVGSPTAGRSAPDLARVVGYFVQPLVLAADFSGRPTFRELLAAQRCTALEAFAHGELPFARIAERLQPTRDPSRSPIFQTLFTLQKAPGSEPQELAPFILGHGGARLSLGPLTLESLELPGPSAQMDLSLAAAPEDEGLRLSLTVSRDLYDEETAQRILAQYVTLLAEALEAPQRPVHRLPLMPPSLRKQVLTEWNQTSTDMPRPALAHRLFEDTVDRAAASPAVTFQGETLTYGELERRANRMAHHLLGLGVGPETLVGVLLHRGPEIPISLLAVLKAGAAYVPLDPAYPKSRVHHMLADSGAPVLITDAALAAGLPEYAGAVVRVDLDAARLDGERPDRPQEVFHDDVRLAYTIYTSGSTGLPKGVQIPHRALVNFIASMAARPGLARGDVLASVTTLSFDIFGLELFLPLAVGAHLLLISRETAGSGRALKDALEEHGATVLQATPTTWTLLTEAGWDGSKPLKALCGGEPLPPDLARTLAARATSAWNLYGPTETTIWSAVYGLRRDARRVLVGRPIANTRIVLLDQNLEPVAPGTPGQLFIGGDGLARGYLGQPAKTASRFLPDGTGSAAEGVCAGDRLYATGDLARMTGAGEVEFLGRLDHQVKIRGHRIELGEIEAVLVDHEGVDRAVLTARRSTQGDSRLVAYVVPADGVGGGAPDLPEVRHWLARSLPEAFLPQALVALPELPLTPNGKVDRKALPSPPTAIDESQGEETGSGLERAVAEIWGEVLDRSEIPLEANFFDLGGHSLLVSRVHSQLETLVERQLPMVELFRHTTVRSLARYLQRELGPDRQIAPRAPGPASGVGPYAVVGLAGRFPGAADVRELWQRLAAGEELIRHFTDEELLAAGVDEELLSKPNYVKASGVLEGADLFDAEFFGFHPREAELMDPQHRIFLEVAWEALENAGYDPGRFDGRIGVFAGVGVHTYIHQSAALEGAATAAKYQIFIGNDKDFVPSRVAYKLGLRGPAINIQTACSSSLVALHLACQSLASGDCDMAMAGGVTVRTPLLEGYLWEEGGIPSPDGHCRAFDAEAAGTVFGSGAGIVVVKTLARALEDGDTVHAVLRGTAVNNDGAAKIGYTAPSVEGQAEVVADALRAAGVGAETLSYVEAHGTGTSLGDPIEWTALTEAFRTGAKTPRPEDAPCALGSVKTNLGHLDTAAGIAGLIKVVCSLEHRQLAPTLHYRAPNPKIGPAISAFRVPTELEDWEPPPGVPRRAGVSSFGIGGTNAHAILEEAPEEAVAGPGDASPKQHHLLVLSARGPEALTAAIERLAAALERDDGPCLEDVAFTLASGRRAFDHRATAVVEDVADAVGVLRDGASQRLRRSVVKSVEDGQGAPRVAFLLPGQGSQHLEMARELYAAAPVFRAELDRCCEELRHPLGFDLRELLVPEALGLPPRSEQEHQEARRRLTDTSIAQPALFAVEWSLAELWRAWGLRPEALLGHSLGEYVAATLSGVFQLSDALAVVAARGRLMATLPPGAMVALEADEEEAQALLAALGRPELELATVNGPRDVVLSGPEEAATALLEFLEGESYWQDRRWRRLHTSHAFHSAMMEPILEAFGLELEKCALGEVRIPFLSNVTGTWITADEASEPDYWREHLRRTVRFGDGLGELQRKAETGDWWFLEVGPGRTLATLARQQGQARRVLTSLPHPRDESRASTVILEALGRLWGAGLEVPWDRVFDGRRQRRVPLPTYPFERRRYWLEARPPGTASDDGMKRREDLAKWLSVPSWSRGAPLPVSPDTLKALTRRRWLVFVGAQQGGVPSVGEQLARRLEGLEGVMVYRVTAGDEYLRKGTEFFMDASRREDYERLLKEVAAVPASLGVLEPPPWALIHAWNADPGDDQQSSKDSGPRILDDQLLAQAETDAFLSLLWIAAAAEKVGSLPVSTPGDRLSLTIISSGVHGVMGNEVLRPERALLLGPLKVLPQEHPGLRTLGLDLDVGEAAAAVRGELGVLDDLLAVLASEVATPKAGGISSARLRPRSSVRALRSGELWQRSFREAPLREIPGAQGENLPTRLRESGVYLVTGGLGGLGLAVAQELAQRCRSRLVLLTRRSLPDRTDWEDRIAVGDPAQALLRQLLALETLGAEVLVVSADVTDEAALTRALTRARERFGPLHGVFHCAGLPGGGIAQLKTVAEARRVLAPKVRGTAILERVLGSTPLDFFLLFSSINAVVGGFGQSDYAAANAFLDVFAQSRFQRRGIYTAAVGWDRWEEVGMAVGSAASRALAGGGEKGVPVEHPLLDWAFVEGPDRAIYVTDLGPERFWELSEHRITGRPTLPGTAYLEMARAACGRLGRGAYPDEMGSDAAIELRDVAFLAPLAVDDGQTRQVVLQMERTPSEAEIEPSAESRPRWQFRVRSSARGTPLPDFAISSSGSWVDHAQGTVRVVSREPAPVDPLVDLATLMARCGARKISQAEGDVRRRENDFLVTGQRWDSLRSLALGEGESVARLELPETVWGDLERYVLHPALLDAGAGAVQFLGEGDFLPLSYDELTVFASIPARSFGWLRLRGQVDDDAETLKCDLSILDEEGIERVRARGFTMRRIGEAMARRLREAVPAAPALDASSFEPKPMDGGIRPAEGVEILTRILHWQPGPNPVVTVRSVEALERRADDMDRDALVAQRGATGAQAGSHARPDLSIEYAEPEGDLEQRIAAVWSRVLGVDRVGAGDNFFELGGSSLNAIQLVSELKDELGMEISNVAIFEAPTVSALARYLTPGQDREAVTEAAQSRAEKKRVALRRNIRRPRHRRPRHRR